MFQVREADPNGNNMRQIDMQESLEKARQKNKGKEDLSKKLLYSQTLLANTFHSHNCNSEMFSTGSSRTQKTIIGKTGYQSRPTG